MFWPIFRAGHVEIYFETVNLNNTHVWLGDRMRAAELKFPRVVIRLSFLSDANWITLQETCAVKTALACGQLYCRMPSTQAIDLSLLPTAPKNLTPGVEGTDSLPNSEPTEDCGPPGNNLSQHYAMSASDSNTTFQFCLGQWLIWHLFTGKDMFCLNWADTSGLGLSLHLSSYASSQ